MLGKRWRTEGFRPNDAKVARSRRAQTEKKASFIVLDSSEHLRSLKSIKESQESQTQASRSLRVAGAPSKDGREQQAGKLTH